MESKSEYQFQGKYGSFFPKNYKTALNVELLLSRISISRENMKNLHEIMQSFRFSNVCFWSYLTRTILEIILRYFIIVKIISDCPNYFVIVKIISQSSKLSHYCQNYLTIVKFISQLSKLSHKKFSQLSKLSYLSAQYWSVPDLLVLGDAKLENRY